MREDQDPTSDPNAQDPTAPTPAAPPLFGGGLTYLRNDGDKRVYQGGDTNFYTDDPDTNSVSGFIRYDGGAAAPVAPKPVEAPRPTGGGGSYQTVAPPARNNPVTFTDPVVDPTNGNTQTKADDLYNHLMEKARQATTVDPNDPNIRRQADTYSANLTRQGRQRLSEMAERAGPTGNIGAESRMMAEKNAQAGAGYEGQLLQHEQDSRRAEISQALTTGAQFLSEQQKLGLQRELANIDNSMKRYQTDLQNEQFGRGLAESAAGRNQSAGMQGAAQAAREREFAQNLQQRAYEYDTDNEYRRSVYADRG